MRQVPKSAGLKGLLLAATLASVLVSVRQLGAAPPVERLEKVRPAPGVVRPEISRLQRPVPEARVYVYDEYVHEQGGYRYGQFDSFDGQGWVSTSLMRGLSSLWVDREGRCFASYWFGTTGTGVAHFTAGYGNPSVTRFTGPLKRAMGMAVDSKGRLYVIDADLAAVVRMDNIGGDNLVTFGSPGSGIGQFKNPTGMYVDGKDRIYVADSGNNRIVQLDTMTGEGWRTYDGKEHGGVGAQVLRPRHIAVDSKGRIYYLRPDGGKVVRVDDISGKGMVQYGHPGGPGATRETLLDQPGGLAIDPWDRIYISDTSNGWVMRLDDMTGAGRKEFWQVGGAKAVRRPTLLFASRVPRAQPVKIR